MTWSLSIGTRSFSLSMLKILTSTAYHCGSGGRRLIFWNRMMSYTMANSLSLLVRAGVRRLTGAQLSIFAPTSALPAAADNLYDCTQKNARHLIGAPVLTLDPIRFVGIVTAVDQHTWLESGQASFAS